MTISSSGFILPIKAEFEGQIALVSAMSHFDDSEIFRSILESLPTGLCVVDMEKRIVLWSDGAEHITGYLRHEVIGHNCIGEALLHCDQPGCEFCGEECPLARAIKTAQPADAPGFLHHKAGYEIPVIAYAVPVHNSHGSIVGAVETFEKQQSSTNSDLREDTLNLPGCMDEATGVASHLMLQSHLREALGTFNDLHLPFGVVCFRVEGLNLFRSKFGAEAASFLLRAMARSLEGALWRTDIVGRWCDDQFLVILNGSREEALQLVRERLRRMLANDAIEWWGERRSLPVSAGYTVAEPGDTVELLMKRAQDSLDRGSAWRSGSWASGENRSSEN
ncbi:MAG TPA: diguanylate cyclase [Verrucomicrobiae bacterium]|nr:diguanylate cyclase [Verrucomicrobiae bacterium]